MVESLKIAFHIGISLSDFWRMTPWHLSIALDAFNARRKVEHQNRAWLAHTTAGLGKIDGRRFPKLADLTGENKSSKVIDESAIKTRLRAYSERVKNDNRGETLS